MSAQIVEQKFRIRHIPKLIKDTYLAWDKDDPWRSSAAVAYYAVLSLPGLLVIIINVVGSIWGRDIVQGQLSHQISAVLGTDAAEIIEGMITQTLDTESNMVSTIVGIATLLFGATGVFYQLQVSLNKIWKVEEISKFSFKKLLTDRAKSFAFILVIGFLLLISFVVTTVISALTDYIQKMFQILFYISYIL